MRSEASRQRKREHDRRERTRATRGLTDRAVTISDRNRLRELPVFEPLLTELLDVCVWSVPQTRGDCPTKRPCVHVPCRYHLYVDVLPSGAVKCNFPDKALADLKQTCALDVADRGGATLERVGRLMNMTRERARQIELDGLAKLGEALASSEVA